MYSVHLTVLFIITGCREDMKKKETEFHTERNKENNAPPRKKAKADKKTNENTEDMKKKTANRGKENKKYAIGKRLFSGKKKQKEADIKKSQLKRNVSFKIM